MSCPPPPPTSSASCADPKNLAENVLRYWQALLTYEEALATRPKARRPTGAPILSINLAEPTAGQDYAKLPVAGREAFLIDLRGQVRVDWSPEWIAFFEDWLALRYRRGEEEESKVRNLLFFPTVYTQRDELAGLLRFPVELEWWAGDRVFEAPSYAQRKMREWPPVPTHALLKQPEGGSEEALPFFIDSRLLRDTLRIDNERIDDFFADLRKGPAVGPRATIEALCALIRDQDANETTPPQDPIGQPNDPKALLEHLFAVLTRRLAQVSSRARVYNVAVIVNGEQSRATYHLQRDIKTSLEALEQDELEHDSALWHYLTGTPAPANDSTCWGRWPKAGLTDNQRAACEVALGSRLSAVQGPPGTGKTTLILNMFAHTLVRKITALARSGTMGRGIAVATSTNNRAVDNVVDPLGRDLDLAHLPLSLRVGSRQVFEKVTLPELERARRWLEAKSISDDQAKVALKTELEDFKRQRSALEERLAPQKDYCDKLHRVRSLEEELEQLRSELRPMAGHAELRTALSALTTAHGDDVERAVDRLAQSSARRISALSAVASVASRLTALSNLAEGDSRAKLVAVRNHWKQTNKRHLPRLAETVGIDVALRLPPSPEPQSAATALEVWEEASESALEKVRELEAALGREDKRGLLASKMGTIERELEPLRAATAVPPSAIDAAARREIDAAHVELFESAVRVREAWACVHRADLVNAVDRAVRAVQNARSLRKVFESSSEASRWLRELYPAWGCTLLSLGNAFPSEQHLLQTVVVDEAGQCHPAYAAGALLRADSALIIGDTHQLEPVFGLGLDDERRLVRGLRLEHVSERLEPYRAYEDSGNSAQSLADRAVAKRPTLIDHFRCQKEIAAICEALCDYGLIAHTPARSRAGVAPFLTSPVLHLPIDGIQNRFAGSWMNEAEVQATLDVVRALLSAGIPPRDIGVITPYRGQLEWLWRSLQRARVPLERPSSEVVDGETVDLFGAVDTGLAVGTVHRFQGGERSIVVFTTTVTEIRSLDFVNARVNLVNVAASRARDHLITIGHSSVLRRGRNTRCLVEMAERLDLRVHTGIA